LARFDRSRKKKTTSNDDCRHPWDSDAKVTKMKDGRTHLAHKAEHAVDVETGAIVAVTLQGADEGDTTTIVETTIAAAAQVEAAQAEVEDPQRLEEIVADKGYRSNQTMLDFDAVRIRSYVAEPDRGRRDWSEDSYAQTPVYRNRRRVRGRRGRRLMRRRGETVERSFADLYDTGGMRRTHLRGHANILKRLLIHASAFNLGLPMNLWFPREWCDSIRSERVQAVAAFGFTERQARFLVTVLIHSGVFIERQYRAFAGIAHGQNTRDFAAKLVSGDYATPILPGALHRGRLFHVQHKALYEAIGEPNNRNRKPASLGRFVERLMILDASSPTSTTHGWALSGTRCSTSSRVC
jgi:hypothetical protein